MLLSLIVAFTITPWMAYHALRGEYDRSAEEPWTLESSAAYCGYSRILAPILSSRALSIGFLASTVALFIAALLLVGLRSVPLKILPFDNKNELQIVIDMPEGTTLEPQAEAGSRTFLVKVGLPRREGVYTGSFGRVIIPAGKRERLLVPAAAVERIGQLTFVTTVDEERRASRRLVTLGPAIGDDHYEVLSGLRAGENVLLR
jgi:hypothetical protein